MFSSEYNRSNMHWNSPGRQVCHAFKQGCILINMVEVMMCGLGSPSIGEPSVSNSCLKLQNAASLDSSDLLTLGFKVLTLNFAGCLW